MARLAYAARNYCVQIPEFIARVADGTINSSDLWHEGWVFDDVLPVILDKESHTAAIVFTERTWQEPAAQSSAKFPLLHMDIWAAPTRDDQNSVPERDADFLIEDIFDDLLPYFHVPDKAVPGTSEEAFIPHLGQPGHMRYWGTAAQIADSSGVPILGSQLISISEFRDVAGGNGVRARSHLFGIETI